MIANETTIHQTSNNMNVTLQPSTKKKAHTLCSAIKGPNMKNMKLVIQ